MILNEYRYITRFETESEAEEYYREHGLKVTGWHIDDGEVIVDNYCEIGDTNNDRDDNAQVDNNKKKNYEIIDKNTVVVHVRSSKDPDFQKHLKDNNVEVGENNIIRNLTADRAEEIIKDYEREHGGIKVNRKTVSQGRENFVQLL